MCVTFFIITMSRPHTCTTFEMLYKHFVTSIVVVVLALFRKHSMIIITRTFYFVILNIILCFINK